MRYAILSDIHGNDVALQAVLADMEAFSIEQRAPLDAIWCLGDIVGYGPEPSVCVRRIREHANVCIAGNHDWAALGKLDLEDFSEAAASSAEWTGAQLSAEERIYLRSLPEKTVIGEFTLAHGSPLNPIWEYLTTTDVAEPSFSAFSTPFCLVGHTHLPTIFLLPTADAELPRFRGSSPGLIAAEHSYEGAGGRLTATQVMTLAPDEIPTIRCEHLTPSEGLWMLPRGYRAIINPGSVGQPRDGDPRASYLIYDDEVGFEFRRVPYDVELTQQKMRANGLSPRMARRLARGI